MPKASERTISTDRQARTIKPQNMRQEYRVLGARNLLLRVTAAGSKSWCFLFVSPRTNQRRKITIGRYPDLSLAAAKFEAIRLAGEVTSGVDPLDRKSSPRHALTFADLAEAFLRDRNCIAAKSNRSSDWIVEQRRLLENDVLPTIGGRAAQNVSKHELREIMFQICRRNAMALADKVLGIIRTIYRWGISLGMVEADPTVGLKKQWKSQPRTRTLATDEILALWRGLVTSDRISSPVKDVIRLQLLLGLRVGEAAEATLSEIDLDKRIWLLPAYRTKSNRELSLPLPDGAFEILSDAVSKSRTRHWLFEAPAGHGPIRKNSVSRALLRLTLSLGLHDIRTHDLRRTCATGLGDLGIADSVIERILNHAPPSVTRRHYNHAKQLSAVREALTKWDSVVASIVEPRCASAGKF